MSGKEEVVEVTEDRHNEVPCDVEEGIVSEDHSPLPDLVLPFNLGDAAGKMNRL